MVFRVVRPASSEAWSVEVDFGKARQRLLEARVEQGWRTLAASSVHSCIQPSGSP